MREKASVTICHSRTQGLAEVANRADYVKEGAVVIDVSIHKAEDGELVGEVRFEEVEPKASAITPVPGGIVPMTRAMLLNNALRAARFPAKRGYGLARET